MSRSSKRGFALKAGAVLAAITLSAGLATPANAGVTITGSGSSAIGNLLDVCIPAYQREFGNTVVYSKPGSGAGRTAFIGNTVDFAMSDGLFGSTDKPGAYAYIPMTQFPLAIMARLDGFKGTLQLSPATITKIFAGKITKWNDAAIVADNTVVNTKTKKKTVAKLPATAITVNFRDGKSGSTGILTGWMKKLAPDVWTTASGETFSSIFPGGTIPAGTFQSQVGSDGLANGVKAKDGSIGYAETSYATERKLLIASVQNNMGEFVQPTAAATSAFINGFTAGTNGAISIDYSSKVKGSYTIAGYTYAIAYTQDKNVGTQAIVRQFLGYVLDDCAKESAAKLGYAPLTGALLALSNKQILLVN